jgi:tetratricopeptide (TPR) repeat protein
MNDAATDHDLYGAVTDEILAELRQGRRPDADALARRYPALGDRLAEYLAELENILRCGPADRIAPIAYEEPRAGVPTILGDFHLLRVVGRGGMGVVYEAEQMSLRRRVALKVLPFAALLEPRRLQRFQQEAQAAGALHHPNIVPVFSVGCDRGVHYYVMQFINSWSLADYVRDLRESVGRTQSAATTPANRCQTIAAWGIQAAEALHHAHELGVVHRDIKPANLLLDDQGILWVTDFGLARLHGETDLTVTGDVVGSLRYMSPEQALGAKGIVDHRADIYSLGATLYELLTLEPALPGGDRDELFRRLVHGEPRPPRSIERSIPRDLETVILKALRKEPTARFATAQDFADDLKRFLGGEPVLARRPTLAERARGWVRRNSALAAAVVIVLLVAVAALTVSTVLITRERDKVQAQREVARARRLEAVQAVNKWYGEFGEKWLAEKPQLEDKEREFVLAALEFFERLATDDDDDLQMQFERGCAYRKAGDIHCKLAEPIPGEAAYRQAIAILEGLAAANPAVSGYRTELAAAHLHDGYWKGNAGRVQESEDALRRALALWGQGAHLPDPLPLDQYGLANTLHALGMLRHGVGRSKEAQQDLGEAQILLEQLIADFPAEVEYRETLSRVNLDQGNVLLETGAPPQGSLKMYRQAQKRFDELPANYRAAPTRRHLEAMILQSLARQLQATAPPAEAVEASRHAFDIMKKLADEFRKIPRYRIDQANIGNNLATQLLDLDRRKEAAPVLREIQDLLKTLADEFPHEPGHRDALAINHLNLGYVFMEMNLPREAERENAAAIVILEPLVRDNPKLPVYRKMLALVLYHMGDLRWDYDRRSEAGPYYQRALDLRTELVKEATPTSAEDAGLLAWSLVVCPDLKVRDWQQAVHWSRKGLESMPNNRTCWVGLGLARLRAGDAAEAIRALKEAQAHTDAGDASEWFCLAMAQQRLGRIVAAHVCFHKGCQWMKEHNPRDIELRRLRAEAAAVLGVKDSHTTSCSAADGASFNRPF